MPILTKAAAPVKGTPTLFTLDKAALAAVTSVAADAYFSDSARWKSVNLVYHSSVGNQNEVVKFEASQSSLTSYFLVSTRARDLFEIQKIVIKDFDGGTFEVLRSELTTAELTTAEFDVDMTVSNNVVWDITGPYTAQPNGGLTTTSTASYSNQYAPSKTTADDFDITFTFASAPTHDAGAGMVTDSNAIYGFIGTSASANIHYNNSGQQVIPFPLWAVGENIFRMTRVGTTITMYLNSVVVGTTNYSGNLKPVVSLHTADVLTSANIVSSIAIPIPFSYNPIAWIPEANYVVEADGGMTSTNTQTSPDAVIFSSTGISGSEDFELSYNINCPSLNFGSNPTSEVFLGFSGSSVTQFYGFYFPISTNILINDQGIYTVPVFSQPILLNNIVKIIKAGTQLTIKWNEVVIYTGTPPIPAQITPCVRLASTDVIVTSSAVAVGRDEELQISQLDFSESAVGSVYYHDNVSQLKGQSITPTRDFLLTGTEFYMTDPYNVYHKVVLRDFTTLAIIASTINYTPTVTGWVRADFDLVPLTAGVKYILELDVEGWAGGQWGYYSGKSGNVYAGGAWMEGSWVTAPTEIPTKDLAFKIHGKSII